MCEGHKPTDYKQWFHATAPYPIHYQNGYEPYLLIDRRLMPLYDERFRGYGYDKVCPKSIAALQRNVLGAICRYSGKPDATLR